MGSRMLAQTALGLKPALTINTLPRSSIGVEYPAVSAEPLPLQPVGLLWTDPSFDPAHPAFYYARVLEDPTCRWSHRLCLSEHVDCATQASDSPLRACCDGSLPDTIQERAWTSPIWYLPDGR
jgi:hypothetical protein